MKKSLLPENTPEAQKNAVEAHGDLITVGAGAGTGKTWVLSGRYVNILATQNEILPADILTLTFTEAAASDMKKRIEARINDILPNFQDESRKRDIQDGISDMWVSTIHSFAIRLIHESGLSLDIDPAASVIPEHQAQEFWDAVKNALEFANMRSLANSYGGKILRDNAKLLDNDDLLSAAVSKWGADALTDLAQKVSEIHSDAGNTWENLFEWLDDDKLFRNSIEPVRKILLYEWRRIWDFWLNIPELPKPGKKGGTGENFINLLEWQNNQEINADNLKNFYIKITSNSIELKGNIGEPFKTLKNYLGGLSLGEWRRKQDKQILKISEKIDEPPSKYELNLRKSLLRFCAVSWGMWDTMKKRRGLLTFADMIVHAKNAIEAGSVKRIFPHILVDEFQDTAPLQFKMIQALAQKNDNTSLFAVGDPKQSIYKFRHADPSLFADTIKKSDVNINLNVSFRTRSCLLEKLNKLFGDIWRGGLGTSAEMSGLFFEPLKPASNDPGRDNVTVPDFLIMLSKKNTSRNADFDARITKAEAKEILAGALADKLVELVNDNATIWDKNKKISRPLKFSDVAVLIRDRYSHDMLEEVLLSRGIKSIQDHSKDFFNRGEVGDVVCMLKAASNFYDDSALSGWLMSPFSDVDEDQAVKILESVNENNKLIEILKNSIPKAYERLKYLRTLGEYGGAAKLLSAFDKNRAWLECYRPNDRLRALRNLRRAIILTSSFQSSGTAGLNSCAEWLSRAVKKNESMDEPSWHDKNENAVLLSTVHSAKGLEYPVTVIFDTSSYKKDNRSNLRASKDLGLAFNTFPDEMNADKNQLIGIEFEKLLSDQGEFEEAMRLFYVAATRAQDCLIFCGITDFNGKPETNTWTEILLDNNPGCEIINVEEMPYKNAVIKNSEHEPEKKLTPVKISMPENYLKQISATSYALFNFCPFAWRRKYKQGLDLKWEYNKFFDDNDDNIDPDDDSENFSGGADLGSLAHWILSRWPVNMNYESELDYYLYDRSILERLPGDLRSTWRNSQAKEDLKTWLLKFANSERGLKIIQAGKKIKREAPFRFKIKDVTLTGSIDALYKTSDGEYHILDYKITLEKNAPSKLYEAQLEFYALAVHEITGCEIVRPEIIFLRENKIESVNISSSWNEIRARVMNFASECANGNMKPDYNNCQNCTWRKDCIAYARQ